MGFIVAMMALPAVLARKEDAITPEDMMGDWNDPKDTARMVKNVELKIRTAYQNEPNMRSRLLGNFLDLVEKGFFKLDK